MSVIPYPTGIGDRIDSSSAELVAGAEAVLVTTVQESAEGRSEAFQTWGTVPPRDFEIASRRQVSPPPGADFAVMFLVVGRDDADDSRWPHKALVAHTSDGDWYVSWILAQCTSCLGAGILGNGPGRDDICETCGGAGWGLLTSEAYPYVPPTVRALG